MWITTRDIKGINKETKPEKEHHQVVLTEKKKKTILPEAMHLILHIRNKKVPGSLSIILDMVLVGGLEVLLGPV